jgi:hypothetical protein
MPNLPPTSNPYPHAAAHWGFASIALGGVFALLAPPGLLLALLLESSGYKGFSQSDKHLAAIGGYASVGVILLLTFMGICFAFTAMSAAAKQGQPVALGLAGLFLNLLALALWIGCGIAWHSQAYRFL